MHPLLKKAIEFAAALHPKPKDEKVLCSVTSLIAPTQQTVLKLRHDPPQDPEQGMKAFTGTAVHALIEKMLAYNNGALEDMGLEFLCEERFRYEVGEHVVSGSADLLWRTKEEEKFHLVDWKTTSAITVKLGSRMEEWEKQLNLYALFAEADGLPVQDITVGAVMYDWRAADAKREEKYPQTDSVEIDVELRPQEKVERLLKTRVNAVAKALEKDDDELPECSAKDRWTKNVRCTKYCACRDICAQFKRMEK